MIRLSQNDIDWIAGLQIKNIAAEVWATLGYRGLERLHDLINRRDEVGIKRLLGRS